MAWQQAASKLRQSQQKAHQVNRSSWHSEDSILLPALETWHLTGANCYQFRFAKQKRNLLCCRATCHMRTETFITIWTCVPVSTMHSDEQTWVPVLPLWHQLKLKKWQRCTVQNGPFYGHGFTITSIKERKRNGVGDGWLNCRRAGCSKTPFRHAVASSNWFSFSLHPHYTIFLSISH